MIDFNRIRRQQSLDQRAFLKEDHSLQFDIALAFESLASGHPKTPNAPSANRWTVAFKSLELLLLGYTAGKPIEDLRAQLPTVIARFGSYLGQDASASRKLPPEHVADTLEITQLDNYVYVFWLLALCKLLRHEALVPEVVRWVDQSWGVNRRRDALFENVVAELTGVRLATPPVMLHPVPYRSLDRVALVPPDERVACMKTLLDEWYDGMEPNYWHDSHIADVHFGYWCLEAALVTVLWNVDDSSYRDHAHYPSDLVDWYRASHRD